MSISGINAYGNSPINYSAPKSVAFRGEEATSSAPQAAEEPKKKGHGGLWLLGLATAGVATYLICKKKNKATTEAAKEIVENLTKDNTVAYGKTQKGLEYLIEKNPKGEMVSVTVGKGKIVTDPEVIKKIITKQNIKA